MQKLLSECESSFNSRTPGGVRRVTESVKGILRRVSIHAPREGCDEAMAEGLHSSIKFQFTHPGRGATNCGFAEFGDLPVSIHAPREGCDCMVQSCLLWGG